MIGLCEVCVVRRWPMGVLAPFVASKRECLPKRYTCIDNHDTRLNYRCLSCFDLERVTVPLPERGPRSSLAPDMAAIQSVCRYTLTGNGFSRLSSASCLRLRGRMRSSSPKTISVTACGCYMPMAPCCDLVLSAIVRRYYMPQVY